MTKTHLQLTRVANVRSTMSLRDLMQLETNERLVMNQPLLLSRPVKHAGLTKVVAIDHVLRHLARFRVW